MTVPKSREDGHLDPDTSTTIRTRRGERSLTVEQLPDRSHISRRLLTRSSVVKPTPAL